MWLMKNKIHILLKSRFKRHLKITILLFVISINSTVSLKHGLVGLSDLNPDKSISGGVESSVASEVKNDEQTERSATWKYSENIPAVPSSIATEARPGLPRSGGNEVTDGEKQNQKISGATTERYLLNFHFEENKIKYTTKTQTASVSSHKSIKKESSPLNNYNKLKYNNNLLDSEVIEEKNWSPGKALQLVKEDCGETNERNWKSLRNESAELFNMDSLNTKTITDNIETVSDFISHPVDLISLPQYIEKERRDIDEKIYTKRNESSDIINFQESSGIGSISNVSLSNTAIRIVKRYNEIFPASELQRNIISDSYNTVSNMNKTLSHLSGSPDKDETQSAWLGRERDRTKLRFREPLLRKKYILPTLRMSEGFLPFRFMSGLFTIVYPFDFPMELVRDFVLQRMTMPQLLFESLKIEASFLAILSFFICLALTIPCYLICRAFLHLMGHKKISAECIAADEDSHRRVTGSLVILGLLAFLTSLSAFGMILSNQLASIAAFGATNTLHAATRDVEAFVTSAHLQLQHAFSMPADVAVQAFREDLIHIDVLLGEPVQKALASETGVDVALDALNDITTVTEGMSQKVSALRELSARGGDLAAQARDQLRDLQRQVDNFKRHCGLHDLKLCETVDSYGIAINMKFDTILTETKLSTLRILGQENLTVLAATARKNFNDVPKAVARQTSKVRKDIIRDLEHRRDLIHVASGARGAWGAVARHSGEAALALRRQIDTSAGVLRHYEKRSWMVLLGTSLLPVVVGCELLGGLACACCGARGGDSRRTARILRASVGLMLPFSLLLWTAVVLLFVIGGHAEVFLCRPLHDYPYYSVLSKFLDKPGYLYEDGMGLFANLYKDLPNITIDVPIGDVLRECSHNRASYTVFRLDRLVDINKETSYLEWEELTADLRRLVIDPRDLRMHTPDIQSALQEMMRASNVNLSFHRMQLNGPITGKDLSALANQLENVANQITDLSTSSRIQTLASRTRRVVMTTLQPLDQIRTDLVYKLTELELQLQPYQRQMNQSLSHLKTIQYYIDNQGGVIADQKIQEYVGGLLDYLKQYRAFSLKASESWALCGPIWDVFDAGRTLLCKHYVDPLNGFWLCSVACLVCWIAMTPLALNVARRYDEVTNTEEALLNDISHGRTTESNITPASSTWSIPRPPPPPRDGAW